MSWDSSWERVFQSRGWGGYPPEELIRFVATRFYAVPARDSIRILEVGCGPGANVWYLAREGFSAVGIDGSETAIRRAHERLSANGLDAELLCGDLTELTKHFEPGSFDAIVDVAALQHNESDGVRRAVSEIHACLKRGGRLFSMLVASGSWGDGLGREVEPGTYSDIEEGPLAGLGVCRFFELGDVERLYSGFEDVHVEYSERSLHDRSRVYRHWVVTAARGR